MTRRLKFNDIYDFSSPIDLQRTMDEKLFVYVEAKEDVRFYEQLVDDRLATYVVFLTPTQDFDSISDSQMGVITALDHQEKRKSKVKYLGICDGDLYLSFGRLDELVETSDLLVEPHYDDFEANVVILGFLERENVSICQGDALAIACSLEPAEDAGKAKPLTDPEERMKLALAAGRRHLEAAISKFATTDVYFRTRSQYGPLTPLADDQFEPEAARVRATIAQRVPSKAAIARRKAGNGLSAEEYETFRLCRGKEALSNLAAISSNAPLFETMVMDNVRTSAFGEAFRAMLRRRVRATLGVELPEPGAEDVDALPA